MYGSVNLMHTLMQRDLIDEYRIWVQSPLLWEAGSVSSGKRMIRGF
jgi:hypothetical protein